MDVAALENRQGESPRGFESHPLRFETSFRDANRVWPGPRRSSRYGEEEVKAYGLRASRLLRPLSTRQSRVLRGVGTRASATGPPTREASRNSRPRVAATRRTGWCAGCICIAPSAAGGPPAAAGEGNPPMNAHRFVSCRGSGSSSRARRSPNGRLGERRSVARAYDRPVTDAGGGGGAHPGANLGAWFMTLSVHGVISQKRWRLP